MALDVADRPAVQLGSRAASVASACSTTTSPTAGLWAGSDTDRWNDELRQRLAFFPWASGSLVPANEIGTLPNNVFLLGRTAGTTGTDPSVLYRINAGGPALTSADDGPDWAVRHRHDLAVPQHRQHRRQLLTDRRHPRLRPCPPATSIVRRPAIFNTERNDPTGGNEMQWNFTVPVGTPIQVRLYMANKATRHQRLRRAHLRHRPRRRATSSTTSTCRARPATTSARCGRSTSPATDRSTSCSATGGQQPADQRDRDHPHRHLAQRHPRPAGRGAAAQLRRRQRPRRQHRARRARLRGAPSVGRSW